MRQTTAFRLAGLAGVLLLNACGGGGSDQPAAPANIAPTANAGTTQTVDGGVSVLLNGGSSSDPDGVIVSYAWTQTAGSAVTLTNPAAAAPSFSAPPAAGTLTFSLVVTDNRGASSAPSLVSIIVNPPNVSPIANAGPAQTVNSGVLVTLDGTGSSDPDGSIAGYSWNQTSGPPVTLSSSTVARPTFTAPAVNSQVTLTFTLVVLDNRGRASGASVAISVDPGGMVSITGVVRYARVPFKSVSPFGLDYANPVMRPARAVRVQAIDATTQAILATGITTITGSYTMQVPAGINVAIQAIARTEDPASSRWNIWVQDGTSSSASPYSYTSATFVSSPQPQQIDIPLGIDSTGAATGVRASGPFAIIDTVYTVISAVLGVANPTFPPLYLNWNSQNTGTFFSTSGVRHINLQGNLTEDTDEFDQHVVAHEFSHYLEDSFSRSDSRGGSHGLGDRLDPRIAFSEGFATAFGAMALNDPLYRDSFVNAGVHVAGGFNIENNPGTTVPNPPDAVGCWCSESSVFAILWDLADNNADANDNVALGLAPMWSVMIGAQRVTPAVTSIFSFIEALKTAQPAFAPGIDTLVAAQNIDAVGLNAFASNETHSPFPNMLPLIPNITAGSPLVVRTIDDGGRENAVGNHRLFRFMPLVSGAVSISVTTSNTNGTPDPDYFVMRSGTYVAIEDDPPPQPETGTFNVTAGTTYIIDAYDCANGCATEEGTPGDYDLTVTIN